MQIISACWTPDVDYVISDSDRFPVCQDHKSARKMLASVGEKVSEITENGVCQSPCTRVEYGMTRQVRVKFVVKYVRDC